MHNSRLSYHLFPDLIVACAYGAYVTDTRGNTYLDATSGMMTVPLGHAHSEIVDAAITQMKRLPAMPAGEFLSETPVELAEKLAAIAPGKSRKEVFFACSGAEAIESAMKMATLSTGRRKFVCCIGGFHGYSLGALTLQSSYTFYNTGFDSNAFRIPYNDEMYLEGSLFRHLVDPWEVAAIFVEPILGSGGVLKATSKFMKLLRELCTFYGILLVVDEVQTGFCRSGPMFAVERYGIEPDMICVAKGIANGLPLSAVIYNEAVANWNSGVHSSTFGGNPVSCAAALKTIEILQRESFQKLFAASARALKRALVGIWRAHHNVIKDVRGDGHMLGVELNVKAEGSGLHTLVLRVMQKCFAKGLLLLGTGGNVVYFFPPLNLSDKDVQKIAEVFESTVKEVRL